MTTLLQPNAVIFTIILAFETTLSEGVVCKSFLQFISLNQKFES